MNKTIVFSHANSFGASTYRVLFSELEQRGFKVHALEQFGHNPKYPVTDNWPHLIEELRDFTRSVLDKTGSPIWMVGHSLGGFLSALTASAYPDLASGIVLLDSPILAGWRTNVLNLAKKTKLVAKVAPAAISKHRRQTWPTVDAALQHFSKKRAFSAWAPQVLRDYVEHGTMASSNGRELSFSREVETAIYSTLPHNMEQRFKKHHPTCPVAFIGGIQSKELGQVGMNYTQKITKGRISMVTGSHLFPMENPHATAAFIEASIMGMV